MSSLPSPDALLSCSWRFYPNQHVDLRRSPPSGDQEWCREGCGLTPRLQASPVPILHFPNWPCQGAIMPALESRRLFHYWICLLNLLSPTVLICCYLHLLKSPKVLHLNPLLRWQLPFLLVYASLQWALEVLVRECLESKGAWAF